MKKRAAGWLKGLALYGLGFGLLAYTISKNWEPTAASPGIRALIFDDTPDLLTFLAVIALSVGTTFAMYVRWYFLVRSLDLPFTLRNAFRLGLVGTFYNAFLPGSVGGDLVKAYFIARDQPSRRAAAVSTVLADRLLGLFGFIWFTALFGGLFWLAEDARFRHGLLQIVVGVCVVVVAVVLVGWFVLGFLPTRRADRFNTRLHSIPKLGRTLGDVWFAVWTYRQRPWTVLGLIAMTAVNHLGMVLLVYLAMRVYPTADPAPFNEDLVLAPIGLTGQAFIPVPGGVGGAEFFFGYLHGLFGHPTGTGVVGRLTMRIVEWGFGFVGYLVFLRMRAELPTLSEAEKVEEPVEDANGNGVAKTAEFTGESPKT